MYVTEKSIQTTWERTLNDLAYAISVFCDLYNLAPVGEYELTCSWGDSILDDPEAQRQDKALDLQLISAGVMQPYEFRMKWYGENEDTAKAMLAEMEEITEPVQTEIE